MSKDLAEGLASCVRCGLCLPHCPTFQLTGDEAESPRGRVVLIQGVLDGAVPADTRLQTHLDNCLHCRRCETVCPAAVPFGSIMDGARNHLGPKRGVSSWLRVTLRHPWLLALTLTLARAFSWIPRSTPATGGSRAVRAFRLSRFIRPRADLETPTPSVTGAVDRSTVALFTGCLDPWMNPQVVEDAVRVIESLGHRAVIPAGQRCCGALHQHAGDVETAHQLQRVNQQVFDQVDADQVVFLSTGCGMTLVEAAEPGSLPPREICAWIEQELAATAVPLASVDGTVAVHRPCSAHHIDGTKEGSDAPLRLMHMIPDLAVRIAPMPAGCCGAAGSYLIDQGDLSDQLGRAMLVKLPADSVAITPNLGCALQIASHTGSKEPAPHPVSVLRMALEGGGSIR